MAESGLFEFSEYVRPLWEIDTITDESVTFIENEDGTVSPVALLFPIKRIISVRSADLLTVYENGRDYTVTDGMLSLVDGSRIFRWRRNEYYFEKEKPNASFKCAFGGYITFGEGSFMADTQLAVTYEAAAKWSGPIPASKLSELPKSSEILRNGKPLKLLYYGDSITTGANASGVFDKSPYMPSWMSLLTKNLSQHYGCDIEEINTAVGGTASRWGAENAQERAAAYSPSLVVLAFGANDIGTAPETFIENIDSIIQTVRAANPDAEFVLVSPWQTNKEVKGFWGNQYMFEDALSEYSAKTEGTTVAPVWSVHTYMLARKRYCDMCGNNVNHPNDFTARMYAQVISAILGI